METTAVSVPQGNQKLIKIIVGSVLCVVVGAVCGVVAAKYTAKTDSDPNQVFNSIQNPTSARADEDSFKIGYIVPLSGDSASYGIPSKQSAAIVEKELNKNGGINGKTVQFIYEDGKCQGEDAKIAAEKLVIIDKVSVIYGGSCSDEFLAAAPIAQENKVITVTTSATSPKISELGKYIFRLTPSDSLAGRAAAQYATTKMSAKTATVIAENTAYAKALEEVFVEEFTNLGGKVINQFPFETGDSDFTEIMTELKKTPTDVVYVLPQSPTPGVIIVKSLKEEGIKSKILTAEVLLTREEVTKQGNVLDKVTGIETYFDKDNKKAQFIMNQYKLEYGKDNTYPTDLIGIYDMFTMLKEAYEKTNSSDPDKISEYLYSLNNWDGGSGKITFDKNGDVISLPYAIQYINNSKVTLIENYSVKQ
jgi:branched-chain amino acid transport system substrate-binding protein